MSAEKKKHPPSKQRLERARAAGNQPYSLLLVPFLVCVSAAFLLPSYGLFFQHRFVPVLMACLRSGSAASPNSPPLSELAMLLPVVVVPVFVVFALQIVGDMFQGSIRFRRSALGAFAPQFVLSPWQATLRSGLLALAVLALGAVWALVLPSTVSRILEGVSFGLLQDVGLLVQFCLGTMAAVLAVAFVLDATYLRSCWVQSLHLGEREQREDQRRNSGNPIQRRHRARVMHAELSLPRGGPDRSTIFLVGDSFAVELTMELGRPIPRVVSILYGASTRPQIEAARRAGRVFRDPLLSNTLGQRGMDRPIPRSFYPQIARLFRRAERAAAH